MDVYEAVLKRRTIRIYKQKPIDYDILEKCVNAARLAPSGANLQPLEYVIADDEKILPGVFETLRWAGYLKNGAPPEGKRPKAYIIILGNREIKKSGFEYDAGLAAGSICLTALEHGLGSCIIGAVERKKLRKLLGIPESREICLVIALGYPDEKSVVEESKGDIKYWKDKNGVLHVPKRMLKDILHRNGF